MYTVEGLIPAPVGELGLLGHQLNAVYFLALGIKEPFDFWGRFSKPIGTCLCSWFTSLWILEGERKPIQQSIETFLRRPELPLLYTLSRLLITHPQEAFSLSYVFISQLWTPLLGHFGSVLLLQLWIEGAVLTSPHTPRADLELEIVAHGNIALLPWFWKWGISFLTMVWRLYKCISHNTKHQLYIDSNIFFIKNLLPLSSCFSW